MIAVMVKWVGFTKRRPDMTREAFIEHWTGPHASIVKRLPGLREYRINILPEDNGSGWDGYVELGFDSLAEMEAAQRSDIAMVELAADGPKFLSGGVRSVAEEIVVVAP
jgi:uncharacterized protein (TIGR02118 family)